MRPAAGGLSAVELRVCDKFAPTGTDAHPTFGWKPVDSGRDALQTHYRLLVSSSRPKSGHGEADVWDSGPVASHMVNAIAYSGPALTADTRYYWRVVLTDDQGNPGPPSEVSHFDVGPLTPADWAGASWVRRESTEENDYTYYRRAFDLPAGRVERAIVSISSCHKYELWVNGEVTGKGPAYHQPQFQYYNAYDVTALLRPGAKNALAVFNRWWGAGQGRPKAERGLIARMSVEFQDGRRFTLATDGSWRQTPAGQWEPGTPKRNRTNGIGFVERIDAARVILRWQEPGFDDSGWAPVSVVGAHPVAPWTGELQPDLTRVIEERHEAVGWTQLGEGHFVADFGKVRAGYPVVRFAAGMPAGTVSLRGGYTLEEDGRVSTRTTQRTDLSYTYAHDGRAGEFRPAEYLGMRYIEIWDTPPGLRREHVGFVSRHYELRPATHHPARFGSSNPTLDRVWQLMVDSIPVCTQEQYIDTPTREKGGFLGDAWSESVAAMLVDRDRTMTRRVLYEYLDSQEAFFPDGRLNHVYPYDHADDIPDYTQMYLVWVWDYYMETGDRAFLAANYERLRAVMAYVMRSRSAQTGLIHDLDGGKGDYRFGIVDWPKSMRYGYDMETEARTVINALAIAGFRAMHQIARTLGRADDAAAYARDEQALADAMNRHLVTADDLFADGLKSDGTLSLHRSQQANMMPLALGIVPPPRRQAVLAHVKSLRMSCGMVTVRWLVEAIGESGDGAHMVGLFTNEEWDGWANSLARGATCTWESWNAIDGNESLSHSWGAIGLIGHIRYILGITPLEPQHARIRVKPLIFGDALTHALGTIPTDRGNVIVGWKRLGVAAFTLDLEVPDSMQAEVWIPCPSGDTLMHNGEVRMARRAGGYLIVETGPGQHAFATK